MKKEYQMPQTGVVEVGSCLMTGIYQGSGGGIPR